MLVSRKGLSLAFVVIEGGNAKRTAVVMVVDRTVSEPSEETELDATASE